jgi:hypothetical protein
MWGIIIIINLTPFELKAMRVSYKRSKTREKTLLLLYQDENLSCLSLTKAINHSQPAITK